MESWLRKASRWAGVFLLMGCRLRSNTVPVTTVGGAGELGKPVTRFPSKMQLAEIMHRAPPPLANDTVPSVALSRWALKGPIPNLNAGYPDTSVWDRKFLRALTDQPVTASVELRCAADELARIFVEHGGFPDEGVRRYLVARCGSSLPSSELACLYGSFSGNFSDERLEQELGPKLDALIAQGITIAPSEMGLGFARNQRRAAFALLLGRSQAKFEPAPLVVAGDQIELKGTVASEAAFVMGLANYGLYGVRHCELDRRVSLPRFAISCPVAEGDALTTIEVVTRRATDMLWEVALRRVVPRHSESGMTYESTSPDQANGADADHFADRLHLAINETRRLAGLPEAQLLPAQSAANQRLARSLSDAARTHNRDDVQSIALGLLAGWDVPGEIRDGGIYWAAYAPVRDAVRWRDAAIESPLGRYSLLNAPMTRIAIGVHHYEPGGALAVVTSYALFENDSQKSDEQIAFRELSAMRAARGLSRPLRLPSSTALLEALENVRAGQPVQAMAERIVERASTPGVPPLSVWVVETNSLYHFTLPGELLRENVECEVGVTHYKPEGAAWGQYVVMIVLHQSHAKQARVFPAGARESPSARLGASSIVSALAL